jgi:shikimate dehydrogenase
MTSFPRPPFYAIIGHPVGHSLSPLMHTTALKALGLPGDYVAVDVESSSLAQHVRELVEQGCAGFNVTIPHKQTIIPFLSEVDEEAMAIGAVNTVVVEHGSLRGYNTDVYGFQKSLEPFAGRIRDKNVVLLGTGGGARAAVRCLLKNFQPRSLTLVARTFQRGQALARALDPNIPYRIITFHDNTLQKHLHDASLIVNATPVGMTPNITASPLPSSTSFHRDQIVFDLIYSPLQTTLLKSAASFGATIVNGLEMLIHQGAKAFELWTGKPMPIEVVRKALDERLRAG